MNNNPVRYGKLQILQEDVDSATCADALNCVLSKAFQRVLNKKVCTVYHSFNADDINRTNFDAVDIFINEDSEPSFLLGADAAAYIRHYDSTGEAAPTVLEYKIVK